MLRNGLGWIRRVWDGMGWIGEGFLTGHLHASHRPGATFVSTPCTAIPVAGELGR